MFHFDWSLNVGNVVTILGLVVGLGATISRHLRALGKIEDIQVSTAKSLDMMTGTLEELRTDVHSTAERIARVEGQIGILTARPSR